MGIFKKIRENQEREREAERRAQEIVKRASKRGEVWGDEYGCGKLTKAQKKSTRG